MIFFRNCKTYFFSHSKIPRKISRTRNLVSKIRKMENKFLKTVLSLFRQLSGVHCPAAAIISSDKTDFHSVGTHLNKISKTWNPRTRSFDLPLVIDSGHGFIWKIIFVTISEFDKFVSKVPCGVCLGLSLRPCFAIRNIIEAFDFQLTNKSTFWRLAPLLFGFH